MVGPPNSGKSRFLRDQSSAAPEVAEYPFTTRTPTPGIVRVDKIPLQFVDLPPVTTEYTEPWLSELIRNCDLILILLDLASDELLEHWEGVMAALARVRVSIDPPPEQRELGVSYRKVVIGGSRADRPGSRDRLEILLEMIGDRCVLPFSLETGEGLPELLREIVRVLDVIRIYTRAPGKEPDMEEPFVLPRGCSVEEAARAIHKELAEKLKFARAWGPRFHDGQTVSRDMVLEDGDVIEFRE
jgi:ribosome-interacting GTPase 1